jgi:peptidoglycan/xylan/chitin deacetylase (PgdA/CDA1 family)
MRLRVLCYHSISDASGDPLFHPYAVPADTFRRQIATLRRGGYTFIHPEDCFNALVHRATLPRNAVLMTFDDCYLDLLEVAQPVLAEHGIVALAFAVSARLGQENFWDQATGIRALPLLNADQLQQLMAGNFEIGSHARTHRRLTRLSDTELADEIVGSKSELEAAGLPAIRFFAYPHGRYDERAFPLLRTAGYSGACATVPGVASQATSPFAVPRMFVYPWDVGSRLLLKVGIGATLRSLRRNALRAIRTRLTGDHAASVRQPWPEPGTASPITRIDTDESAC